MNLLSFTYAEFDSLQAKRITLHKLIEVTGKLITQVFADQFRSEIIMDIILMV